MTFIQPPVLIIIMPLLSVAAKRPVINHHDWFSDFANLHSLDGYGA